MLHLKEFEQDRFRSKAHVLHEQLSLFAARVIRVIGMPLDSSTNLFPISMLKEDMQAIKIITESQKT